MPADAALLRNGHERQGRGPEEGKTCASTPNVCTDCHSRAGVEFAPWVRLSDSLHVAEGASPSCTLARAAAPANTQMKPAHTDACAHAHTLSIRCAGSAAHPDHHCRDAWDLAQGIRQDVVPQVPRLVCFVHGRRQLAWEAGRRGGGGGCEVHIAWCFSKHERRREIGEEGLP